MRVNIVDESDEVALLPRPGRSTSLNAIQGYISMAENNRNFQDIEVKNSKSLIKMAAGALGGGAAGAATGAAG